MPRRDKPDTLSLRVGRRIKELREASGLTLEKLAYESELGSKGHLSDIEHGLVRPNVQTLKVLADHLGVALLDLVTFPEDDDRQRLIELSRGLPQTLLRRLVALAVASSRAAKTAAADAAPKAGYRTEHKTPKPDPKIDPKVGSKPDHKHDLQSDVSLLRAADKTPSYSPTKRPRTKK